MTHVRWEVTINAIRKNDAPELSRDWCSGEPGERGCETVQVRATASERTSRARLQHGFHAAEFRGLRHHRGLLQRDPRLFPGLSRLHPWGQPRRIPWRRDAGGK